MGCCCSIFARCEPCCQFIGCSCTGRGDDNMTDIEKNRGCTDVPWLVFFVGFVIFLVAYTWVPSLNQGDPNRLIKAVQFDGQICGSGNMAAHKYGYWPDVRNFRFRVCVDKCERTQSIDTISGVTTNVPYPTKLYLNRYCVPDTQGGNATAVAGFSDSANQFQDAMADVQVGAGLIGASAVIALVFAFAYLLFLRMCVGCLVWTTIALILIGGACSGYTLLTNAATIEDANTRAVQEYFSYFLLIATFIFFVVIVWARDRIRIAIEVIRSAGRALTDMKLLVLFPLNTLIVACGFFAVWMVISVYMFSAGDTYKVDSPASLVGAATYTGVAIPAQFDVINYQATIESKFAPHFFGLLWVFQFCIYFAYLVISGAVADWYFTARDENGHKIRGDGEMELGSRPVCDSCFRSARYHLGTVAVASFIIAAIQFARWCIRYMERMMNGGKEPNRLQKLLMRVLDCLLWCLECCLDKISRSALIFTAIYGDAFCPAVCGSFALTWRNLARVAVISFFSTIITALGKVMIPLLTVGLCGLIFLTSEPYKSGMNSMFFPLALILVLSYFVGYMFLVVYDTAIDTVFMCFLIDEEANKKSGTMLADESLKNIVQKYEAESKELAGKMGSTGGAEGKGTGTGTEVQI